MRRRGRAFAWLGGAAGQAPLYETRPIEWPRRAGLAPLLLCLATFPAPATPVHATRPAADADTEIRALIAQLGDSACRFQRNGRWYEAAQAQAHLQRKYGAARRRGLSGDAEAFIEHAASRSSLSGRDYHVACPGQPERAAGDWFRARLAELRAAGPAPR